jgi:pilus assembly protein CpaB
MNKNLIIVVAGALLMAVLVVALMQLVLGGKEEAAPVAEEPKVELLVAAKNLSMGDKIKPDSIRWQKWPKSNVFPGAITRKNKEKPVDALEEDSRVARDIAEGEPVVPTALVGKAKDNFVAASLEQGHRAVAIEVSASSMVGGFVSAGDYVDVMITYKDSAKSDDDDPRVQEMMRRNLKKYAAETILQNVRVLAVDQKAERPEDGKVKVGKTVTLDLTLEQAEKLALAGQLGELTLALRGIGDQSVVERSWPTVTDSRLITIDDEISDEYNKMKGDTVLNPDNVRIYNGATVNDMAVQ